MNDHAIIVEAIDEHELRVRYYNSLVRIDVRGTSGDHIKTIDLDSENARALAEALLDKADELDADEKAKGELDDFLGDVFQELDDKSVFVQTAPEVLRRRLASVNLQAITDKAAFYARAAATGAHDATAWEDLMEEERDVWREAIMNANPLPRGRELAAKRTARINEYIRVLNVIQSAGRQNFASSRKGPSSND